MHATIIHTDIGVFFEEDMPDHAIESYRSVVHLPDATTMYRPERPGHTRPAPAVAHIVMNRRKTMRLLLNAEQLYETARTKIWENIYLTAVII